MNRLETYLSIIKKENRLIMAKYSEKLAGKIITLIEDNNYTISEVCKILSISRKSFYEWKNFKPEFARQLDEAMDRRDEKLMMGARKALQRKIEGYTLTEKKTTYIPDKDDPSQLIVKNVVVKEKEYAPDTRSIKLILKRYDEKMDKKEETNVQPKQLTFVANNEKTAESLRILRDRLQNGT